MHFLSEHIKLFIMSFTVIKTFVLKLNFQKMMVIHTVIFHSFVLFANVLGVTIISHLVYHLHKKVLQFLCLLALLLQWFIHQKVLLIQDYFELLMVRLNLGLIIVLYWVKQKTEELHFFLMI